MKSSVPLRTSRAQARAVASEIAVYVATVTHWGHGRTPTNQQLRDLAEDLESTWESAKILEILSPDERPNSVAVSLAFLQRIRAAADDGCDDECAPEDDGCSALCRQRQAVLKELDALLVAAGKAHEPPTPPGRGPAP